MSLASELDPSDLTSARSPAVYFGYGSNLWRAQMRQRCPTSKFLGVARLKGYRWIIYERGYANIVEITDEDDDASSNESKHDYTKEVWGLVYSLEADDEKRLDKNEGVPVAYQKENIECEFWLSSDDVRGDSKGDDGALRIDIASRASKKRKMLVYINRKMTKESKPKEEYIYRMNMGIKDALHEGVPKEYVQQAMRKYIPNLEDERVKDAATKQALQFEDET